MATLTSSNYTKIRQIAASDATTKAVFKALALSKTNWYAVFQAVEDWFVNGFSTAPATSLKAAIDTAAGVTTTAAQARRRIALTWIKWRFGEDL